MIKEVTVLKRILRTLLIILVLCSGLALAASDPKDKAGSKDPPLFSRMPDFWISLYQETEFDRYEFPIGDKKKTAVEGHYYRIDYSAKDKKNAPAGLQIARNYINAAKAIGGQVVYDNQWGNNADVVLKVVKKGMETWTHLTAEKGYYTLKMIEKQGMEQDVTANADSMAQSIKDTGKATIYGIYFDTGKAEIKPDSEPSLKEITKLLQADPKLKLYVVGHTDNVGTFDYNIKLSNGRADAVVKALVGKYGIATFRLQPFGAGPVAPVESNQTEEGRAKNRRVELVAQ
jgi:outer membrane protein OmpA-like peptidoglycan-associated protein